MFKKRIEWIDMAKGYGMILVVVAHLTIGNNINIWINSFHMPLFFMLSGYVFSDKNNFPTFLKKKCKSLLLPYLCLGIPVVIFDCVYYSIHHTFTLEYWLTAFWKYIVQIRQYTLWFLAVLFFLNIIFYCAKKILKKNLLLAVFSIASFILGLIYYKLGGPNLPWNIDAAFMALPFFFIGYFYKCNHEKIDKFLNTRKRLIFLSVPCLIINCVFCFLSYNLSGKMFNMFDSTYGIVPLTFIGACAGAFSVILISKLSVFKSIQYVGRNTLLYFAWHQAIFMPLSVDFFAVFGISITNNSSSIDAAVLYFFN